MHKHRDMHAQMFSHTGEHKCMHTHVHTNEYTQTQVHTQMYTHIGEHMYMHTYAYISPPHTHIHTQKHLRAELVWGTLLFIDTCPFQIGLWDPTWLSPASSSPGNDTSMACSISNCTLVLPVTSNLTLVACPARQAWPQLHLPSWCHPGLSWTETRGDTVMCSSCGSCKYFIYFWSSCVNLGIILYKQRVLPEPVQPGSVLLWHLILHKWRK